MDDTPASYPPALDWLRRDTEALGFDLASQPKTGAILVTLAASKPGWTLYLPTSTAATTLCRWRSPGALASGYWRVGPSVSSRRVRRVCSGLRF
jgi:hypothetical protein